MDGDGQLINPFIINKEINPIDLINEDSKFYNGSDMGSRESFSFSHDTIIRPTTNNNQNALQTPTKRPSDAFQGKYGMMGYEDMVQDTPSSK